MIATVTDDETLTLMMALASEGFVRTADIAQGLETDTNRVWYICSGLRSQGAMTHHSRGLWQITEKGRIACALAMHKDHSLAMAFFDEEPT